MEISIESWWKAFAGKTSDLSLLFQNKADWDLPGWMHTHLNAIDRRLLWEFGPGIPSGHRLVITPETDHHLRPLVDQILAAAPKLPGWSFHPWRLAEDRIRFDGHDTLSATMADAILARFHAPLELRAVVAEVCREHIHFAALPGMRPAKRERWLRGKHFAVHLAFHRADCLGSHGKLELYEFAARAHKALGPVPEVLVTGSDVLALGLQPGPMVGKLLAQVHAAADEAPVPMDRAGALRLLRELVEGARQDGGPPAR